MKSNVLVANIRARKSESTVVTLNKTIEVNQNLKLQKSSVNFPMQSEKEVKNLFQSKHFATLMGSVSILLAKPVFAEEGIMGVAQSNQMMSSGDFIEMFIKAAVYLNVAAVGISIAKPAIIHMVNFFSPSLAENMSNRLSNGLGITLYWQMIVIGMVYLAHLLLGSSPYYIDTWAIIAPHIKPAIQDIVSQFNQ